MAAAGVLADGVAAAGVVPSGVVPPGAAGGGAGAAGGVGGGEAGTSAEGGRAEAGEGCAAGVGAAGAAGGAGTGAEAGAASTLAGGFVPLDGGFATPGKVTGEAGVPGARGLGAPPDCCCWPKGATKGAGVLAPLADGMGAPAAPGEGVAPDSRGAPGRPAGGWALAAAAASVVIGRVSVSKSIRLIAKTPFLPSTVAAQTSSLPTAPIVNLCAAFFSPVPTVPVTVAVGCSKPYSGLIGPSQRTARKVAKVVATACAFA